MNPPGVPEFSLVALVIQGLFAVVLCGIGFFLAQISGKLEKLTDAIADLRVEMVTDFVTKDDWSALRIRLQDLGDDVAELQGENHH